MSISNKITHYQEKIGRNKEHTETLIHCINKLHKLPIAVKHLEETQIGKTINELRKFDGGVGNAAKALISKWKRMVFFEETIAEEPAEKDVDLKNPKISNSKEDDSNSPETEKQPTLMKEDMNALSDTARNDSTEMPQEIYGKGHISSTASINCNVSEDEIHNILHQSTEKENKAHSSTERIRHVLPINQNNSKTKKQKDSHRHCHRNKHHNCNRMEKLKHNKKCKDLDNELRRKKDRIKIKLEKVYTGGVNNKQKEKNSVSSSSSKHKHCSKRSENETKYLDSKHCHKEQGLKQTAGPNQRYNEKIIKKPKSSKKITEKVALGDSVDLFAEALRQGDAVRNKRPRSTTTIKMQNSESNNFSSTKTTGTPFNTTHGINPPKPYLCLEYSKLEPLDKEIDLVSILSEIPSNYNPLPHLPLTKKAAALDAKQVTLPTQHRHRTKVHSGVKTGQPVPTLYELCIHVLKKHIDALEYTGGVPYDILKPILQQATAEQLFQVEYYNPYLMEDTNELWELHCQKEFRSGQLKPMESAREMYLRCLAEREAKLKAITCNKPPPIQQIKLAYVDNPKPPRNVARKLTKYGTRNIPKSQDGKSQRSASVLNPLTSTARLSILKKLTNSTGQAKPRLAPLMQKTLKLAKKFKRQSGYT